VHKLTTLVLAVAALAASVASANEAEVRKNMQARYPNVPVESVQRTPLPGIYEVYANGVLIYTDEKVNYVFVEGRMIDAAKRIDLTEARLRKLQAIAFDTLPLDSAFKMVRGNGKRKVAYFADPNCGYCKKFEQELLAVNDVTIHVFMYPILSPDSFEKSKSVWCSKDRVKAWNDWMQKGVVPTASGACNNPIEKIVEFGRAKGINGTPTLVFADGSRVPGMIPAGEMQKMLDAPPAK
jgi:thiol:disulfide interchange protein DsbC